MHAAADAVWVESGGGFAAGALLGMPAGEKTDGARSEGDQRGPAAMGAVVVEAMLGAAVALAPTRCLKEYFARLSGNDVVHNHMVPSGFLAIDSPPYRC